jgi:hypothetical protein
VLLLKNLNKNDMQPVNGELRSRPFRPIFSSLLGIVLLLPASFFILTIVVRICFGTKSLYYSMAPSFLQSPFDLFAFHRTPEVAWSETNHTLFAGSVLYSIEHAFRQSAAQIILGCLLLAILFNLLTVLRFRLVPGRKGPEVQVFYRRYWLNTAIALQSGLLLVILVAYTLIQHMRY